MKSVKIMNTTYIIGDTYKLNGMFFNSGDRVTLRPTVSINVECKALSVDASGTLLEIVDIIQMLKNFLFELLKMKFLLS